MHSRLFLAGLAAAALACPLIIAACSDDPDVVYRHVKAGKSTKSGSTSTAVDQATAADDDDAPSTDCSLLCTTPAAPVAQDAGPPAAPAVCSLPELAPPAVVTPGFMQVDSRAKPPVAAPTVDPNVKMEAMAGTYQIDKATVWLPEALNGLVTPAKSTGTVKAGAIVVGDRHRFSFHAKVSVSSKKGPQDQSIDVESYGTQGLAGGVIKLTSSCEAQPIPASAIEFIDNGGGRVTFLLRTPATGPNKKPVSIITTLEAARAK